MDLDAILKRQNRGFADRYIEWDVAIAAMKKAAKRRKPSADNVEFFRIIAAASHLGEGRQRHIRAHKRLVFNYRKAGTGKFPASTLGSALSVKCYYP